MIVIEPLEKAVEKKVYVETEPYVSAEYEEGYGAFGRLVKDPYMRLVNLAKKCNEIIARLKPYLTELKPVTLKLPSLDYIKRKIPKSGKARRKAEEKIGEQLRNLYNKLYPQYLLLLVLDSLIFNKPVPAEIVNLVNECKRKLDSIWSIIERSSLPPSKIRYRTRYVRPKYEWVGLSIGSVINAIVSKYNSLKSKVIKYNEFTSKLGLPVLVFKNMTINDGLKWYWGIAGKKILDLSTRWKWHPGEWNKFVLRFTKTLRGSLESFEASLNLLVSILDKPVIRKLIQIRYEDRTLRPKAPKLISEINSLQAQYNEIVKDINTLAGKILIKPLAVKVELPRFVTSVFVKDLEKSKNLLASKLYEIKTTYQKIIPEIKSKLEKQIFQLKEYIAKLQKDIEELKKIEKVLKLQIEELKNF